MNKIKKKISLKERYEKSKDYCFSIFFVNGGTDQKRGFVILGVLFPIILSVWAIIISKDNSDIKQEIKLLTESVNYFKKIASSSDSISSSTKGLRNLPAKLAELGKVLDTLSFTIGDETRKLENSYSSLNQNYDLLIHQQKSYLDKISNVVALTNEQIKQLGANNKMIFEQYSRRVVFSAKAFIKEKKGRYYLDHIIMTNSGNIEANIERLIFVLPPEFICTDSLFQSLPNEVVFDKTHYGIRLNTDTELNIKRINSKENIFLNTKCDCYFKNKKDISILFQFTFYNQYESEPKNGIASIEFE